MTTGTKWTVVSDKTGMRVPHLVLRGGRYYLDITIRKKRYLRRIEQDTLGAARATAAAMIRALRANPATTARIREESPSIAALITHYRTAAEYRRSEKESPSVRSSENCIASLLLVLKQGLGTDNPEALNCSALTDELVHKYVKARVEAAGQDLQLRQRARLSAASTMNQARAIFARWAMDHYRSRLVLNVESFLKCSGAERVVKHYVRPPEALVAATLQGAAALLKDNPDLYTVILLDYTLGLRAGTIENLQWSWFFQNDGRQFLRLERQMAWKTKGREHTIAVSDKTWTWLVEHKTDPVYVIKGANKTQRHNMIRAASAWIRSMGWDSRTYTKTNHELRKLFGCVAWDNHGPNWASEWLGHADIRTTRQFYAEPSPKAHPAAISM
jgi:integrase